VQLVHCDYLHCDIDKPPAKPLHEKIIMPQEPTRVFMMGLQAIKTAPEAVRRAGHPVFLLDHDADDVNAAHRAVRLSVLSYVGSTAFCSIHGKAESRSASNSRGTSTVVARTSAAAGAYILCQGADRKLEIAAVS
jgi:hypothetical protein